MCGEWDGPHNFWTDKNTDNWNLEWVDGRTNGSPQSYNLFRLCAHTVSINVRDCRQQQEGLPNNDESQRRFVSCISITVDHVML